jgi:hypothetical protein
VNVIHGGIEGKAAEKKGIFAAGAAAEAGARERAARLEAERIEREERRLWEARIRLLGAVNRAVDRRCDIQEDKRLGKDSPAAAAAQAEVHALLGQLERLQAAARE